MTTTNETLRTEYRRLMTATCKRLGWTPERFKDACLDLRCELADGEDRAELTPSYWVRLADEVAQYAR